ncbi:MAG TPA: energy transducer TonB [Croceibacterium sp.]|jgi:protein TonB
MAFEQLNRKNRAVGVAGALAVNALLVAGLLSLSTGIVPLRDIPGLVAFDVNRPPPPPPPHAPERKPAGAAPSSRGATKAPSPLKLPHPLPKPTPSQPSRDTGSQAASGAGTAAGSGAGKGGEGNGSGAGGSGNGAGAASQPVHLAGDFTASDYRRSGLRGGQAQVVVSMRVRADGGVDQCRVARSSGNATVDSETCAIIEQRFRFRPALSASGQPVDTQIQWQAIWNPR